MAVFSVVKSWLYRLMKVYHKQESTKNLTIKNHNIFSSAIIWSQGSLEIYQ
jgi:hypothetical protein